jgi:hypothetical protein
LMLKFFMLDGKWGASDVAEGVDYPQTSARFRKRNMTFRLTIFTVVVRARGSVLDPSTHPSVMLLPAKLVHVAKDIACPTAVCFDIQLMGQ